MCNAPLVSRTSICPANPHLHESVGNAVNLCVFLILIGQKLFLQQSADGVLYGAGRFECMLLHKTGRGDTAGFAFFGNGNQRFFLLIVELVHDRGKGSALLFQDVAQRLIDARLINDLVGIQIGKCVVEHVVDVVGYISV